MGGSWACHPSSEGPGDHLFALYDDAVGEVYRYLLARCRNRTVAEDLTSEVFMAAVDFVTRGRVDEVTTAWLIGIARHKLVDHWRRAERDQRRLTAVADEPTTAGEDDPWDAQLDVPAARDVLEQLGAHHRSRPHAALPRRAERARVRRRPRPHRPRHRGAARAGQAGVPRHLRAGEE